MDALEITQGIQDLNNSVPLVANRRTYARAHVRANWASVPDILGTFSVIRDSSTLGPYAADNPWGRITVRSDPDRGKAGDSFFFEIPPSMLGPGTTQVCFNLNSDGFVPEDNFSNNSTCSVVPLTESPPARVKVYNIRYQLGATTHVAPASDVEQLISWLRRAYPVPAVEWESRTLDWNDPVWPPAGGCAAINAQLALLRFLDGSPAGWRYYGMAVDTGGFMQGCAAGAPSTVASGPTGDNTWGWDTDGSYGDWYGGHELGHTYGRLHAACGSGGEPDPGYPYPGGVIGGPEGDANRFYGWDVELKQPYPPTRTDIMAECGSRWISDYTYAGIRSQLISESGAASAAAAEHLLVLGRADLALGTAALDALYRMTDVVAPALPTPSLDWTLTLLDAGGDPLASYPFTPKTNLAGPGGATEPQASIMETIPWASGAARVAILHEGTEVASRAVSANAPNVTLLYPNGGESLYVLEVVVRWTAIDPDGDLLTAIVQYSPDAGATWQTIALGTTGDSYRVNLLDLPGSKQALFRVIASDGVNTRRDQSDGLLEVATKPPVVSILAPVNGARFTAGQQAVFVGEGRDVEDGAIPGSALRWYSNRQGFLGAGTHVSASALMSGRHAITLQTTDSNGKIGSAAIVIYAGAPPPRSYLPVVMR